MMVREYMSLGLTRDKCLQIVDLSKNQFYHKSSSQKAGRKASIYTEWKDPKTSELVQISNRKVVDQILIIKSDPDQANWYKLICYTLQVKGYYINHKKVYRLMQEYHLLGSARKKKGRTFVKFRRVIPAGPLRILEMDIKYIWIEHEARYCYVLTVIDTFTRYVLDWAVGYTMRKEQVKALWEQIIVHHLQPAKILGSGIEIEVRNDNGKQMSCELIQNYFKENYLNQVFTHPYSPEENGHVESFHKTLGSALKTDSFQSLSAVEKRLEKFYLTYNNTRQHGSIAMLSPRMFWALYEDDQIDQIELSVKRTRFRLKIAYQDVEQWPSINKYRYRVKRA